MLQNLKIKENYDFAQKLCKFSITVCFIPYTIPKNFNMRKVTGSEVDILDVPILKRKHYVNFV